MENIVICDVCEHKMTHEQKLCHHVIVGIKYLRHYECALWFRKKAKKTLEAIANTPIPFFTGNVEPFEKFHSDYKIRANYSHVI